MSESEIEARMKEQVQKVEKRRQTPVGAKPESKKDESPTVPAEKPVPKNPQQFLEKLQGDGFKRIDGRIIR